MNERSFSFASVALLSLSVAACGGHASGPSSDLAAEAPNSEDALTSGGLGLSDVAAVQIKVKPMMGHFDPIDVTIASPKKLAKAKDLKRSPHDNHAVMCAPDGEYTLKYLAADGSEIGTVPSLLCGSGRLELKGKSPIDVSTSVDLKELAQQPLVPGDALWGIDTIVVARLHPQVTVRVDEAPAVKKLVDAIDPEQKIDPQRSMPRCLPTYTVSFNRNHKEVAVSTFLCADGNTESAWGNFFIEGANRDADPLASGAVELDPRPFRKVIAAEE